MKLSIFLKVRFVRTRLIYFNKQDRLCLTGLITVYEHINKRKLESKFVLPVGTSLHLVRTRIFKLLAKGISKFITVGDTYNLWLFSPSTELWDAQHFECCQLLVRTDEEPDTRIICLWDLLPPVVECDWLKFLSSKMQTWPLSYLGDTVEYRIQKI